MSISTYRNLTEFCERINSNETRSIWELPKRVVVEGLFYIKKNDVGRHIVYYCEDERHYIDLELDSRGKCTNYKAYYYIEPEERHG